MTIPSWEDPHAFLQLDDFAVMATVQPQEGVPRQVRGIFDDPTHTFRLGEYEREGAKPQFTCLESDVADLRADDSVSIEGHEYYLAKRPKNDGTGFTVLVLNEG